MDLNYLFHRQQVERSRARAADTMAARQAHEELAQRYEEEIARLTAEGFSIGPDDDLELDAADDAQVLSRGGGNGRFNASASEGPAGR